MSLSTHKLKHYSSKVFFLRVAHGTWCQQNKQLFGSTIELQEAGGVLYWHHKLLCDPKILWKPWMHISFWRKIRKKAMSLDRSVVFFSFFICIFFSFCIPLHKACPKLQVQEYFSVPTFTPLAALLFSVGERDGRVRENGKSIIILIKAKLSKGKFNIPKKVCEIRLLGCCLGAVWNWTSS